MQSKVLNALIDIKSISNVIFWFLVDLKMLETRIRHVQRHIMVFYSKSTRLAELIDRYRLKLDDGDEGIITIDSPRRGDYPK